MMENFVIRGYLNGTTSSGRLIYQYQLDASVAPDLHKELQDKVEARLKQLMAGDVNKMPSIQRYSDNTTITLNVSSKEPLRNRGVNVQCDLTFKASEKDVQRWHKMALDSVAKALETGIEKTPFVFISHWDADKRDELTVQLPGWIGAPLSSKEVGLLLLKHGRSIRRHANHKEHEVFNNLPIDKKKEFISRNWGSLRYPCSSWLLNNNHQNSYMTLNLRPKDIQAKMTIDRLCRHDARAFWARPKHVTQAKVLWGSS